jgi:hypothetical protein
MWNADLRRSWRWLALAPVATCPSLLQAQAPVPAINVNPEDERPPFFRAGAFDFHVRAVTSLVYDDNISLYENSDSSETRRRPLGEDFVFTFSPGVTLLKASTLEDSRTSLALDYAPSFIFFAEHDGENSIDHLGRFEAGYALTKLTFHLSQDYAKTASTIVDAGDRVTQENFRTTLGARYELSQKTFLRADGTFRVTDYDQLTDSHEWSFLPTANYELTPKVTLGLGINVGQLFVDEQQLGTGTNRLTLDEQTQTYVGPTLRAVYKTTAKTDVTLLAGGEWRTYSEGGNDFGPVFSLKGTYRPFDSTALMIEGHRREQNSAVVSGANFVATGVSLGVRQRLFDRIFGEIRVSYDHSEYKSTVRRVAATRTDREDDYVSIRYGVEAALGRHWTLGVFHQYRNNDSNEEAFTFDNNQVGVQLTWRY